MGRGAVGEWDPFVRRHRASERVRVGCDRRHRRAAARSWARRHVAVSSRKWGSTRNRDARSLHRARRAVGGADALHRDGPVAALEGIPPRVARRSLTPTFPTRSSGSSATGRSAARSKTLAAELGIERQVKFWGALERQAALAKFGECHVLVHPSLHDSGGWVCVEAMAAGRPVVCLDLGGSGGASERRVRLRDRGRHSGTGDARPGDGDDATRRRSGNVPAHGTSRSTSRKGQLQRGTIARKPRFASTERSSEKCKNSTRARSKAPLPGQ